MWSKIQYVILYSWVKVHALLPMRLLYVLSDFLYIIIYRVIRYRLRVVRRNMKASFPDKSEVELHRMEREFYHHLSDYIVETIKLAHIPLKDLQKRALLKNPQLVDELMREGHTCCMLLMGHYGNWEWFSGSASIFENSLIYEVYRPLRNKAFDRLFLNLRTHFGSHGIKKNDTIRDLIELKKEGKRSVVIFLADQTPSKANLHYWTTFLNQETSVLNGPERIARKLNLPVVFADIRKPRRGYYVIDFKLITAAPKTTPENWITEQYARQMEKSILRNPAYWLWTHKRWKYKKEES